MEIRFLDCPEHTAKHKPVVKPTVAEIPPLEERLSSLPLYITATTHHIHCAECGCIKSRDDCPDLTIKEQNQDEKGSPELEQNLSSLIRAGGVQFNWEDEETKGVYRLAGNLPPGLAALVFNDIRNHSNWKVKN